MFKYLEACLVLKEISESFTCHEYFIEGETRSTVILKKSPHRYNGYYSGRLQMAGDLLKVIMLCCFKKMTSVEAFARNNLLGFIYVHEIDYIWFHLRGLIGLVYLEIFKHRLHFILFF